MGGRKGMERNIPIKLARRREVIGSLIFFIARNNPRKRKMILAIQRLISSQMVFEP